MLSENALVDGKAVADLPVVVIEPRRGWIPLNLPELFQYRELVLLLAWRDVKVRYKQTVLGALWAILQPVVTMLVFSLFFGRLGKMPSDGVPYLSSPTRRWCLGPSLPLDSPSRRTLW